MKNLKSLFAVLIVFLLSFSFGFSENFTKYSPLNITNTWDTNESGYRIVLNISYMPGMNPDLTDVRVGCWNGSGELEFANIGSIMERENNTYLFAVFNFSKIHSGYNNCSVVYNNSTALGEYWVPPHVIWNYLGDDFNDGVKNTSIWTHEYTGGGIPCTLVESGGYVNISAPAGGSYSCGWDSDDIPTNNTAFFKVRTSSGVTESNTGYMSQGTSYYSNPVYGDIYFSGSAVYIENGITTRINKPVITNNYVYNWFALSRNVTGSSAYVNNNISSIVYNNEEYSPNPINFVVGGMDANHNPQWSATDYVGIKYTHFPEVTYSIANVTYDMFPEASVPTPEVGNVTINAHIWIAENGFYWDNNSFSYKNGYSYTPFLYPAAVVILRNNEATYCAEYSEGLAIFYNVSNKYNYDVEFAPNINCNSGNNYSSDFTIFTLGSVYYGMNSSGNQSLNLMIERANIPRIENTAGIKNTGTIGNMFFEILNIALWLGIVAIVIYSAILSNGHWVVPLIVAGILIFVKLYLAKWGL